IRRSRTPEPHRRSTPIRVAPRRLQPSARWSKLAPRRTTLTWRNPMNRSTRLAILGALGVALAFPVLAQTVKVTPLGGIAGEFCPQDRALVFEAPNGTRILYDPGRTVAGANDPRLGKIDIILVSHMHGDHVGNAHNKEPNSGSCAMPDMSVSAMPNSS